MLLLPGRGAALAQRNVTHVLQLRLLLLQQQLVVLQRASGVPPHKHVEHPLGVQRHRRHWGAPC
jgi:hypothetical protein